MACLSVAATATTPFSVTGFPHPCPGFLNLPSGKQITTVIKVEANRPDQLDLIAGGEEMQ
jgi:hypothetical protein